MMISRLIEQIEVKSLIAFKDMEVTGISTDSRSVKKGELFVALRGSEFDGHNFVDEAISRGAAALLVENEISSSVPAIVVEDTRVALAGVAKIFYGDPAKRLTLVGVTGTNGKTSTVFLLKSILERSTGSAGIIGTIGFGAGDEFSATTNTTPSLNDLYRILADFAGQGCKSVAMEVSSHSTVQKRIEGLEFDVGVFTNITRDHLDYHQTMENYIAAKELLAKSLVDPSRKKKPGVLVYNIDDSAVRSIADRFKGEKLSYGLSGEADFTAVDVEADINGTAFELKTNSGSIDIALRLLGTFSVYNALAAAAAAMVAGADLNDIKKGLEAVSGVPGRFQIIHSGPSAPVVVVDYAHTPDALERLLGFCKELGPERLITVFGAGGDRDRGKRPLMGRIAYELSDTVVITDDNPRTEDGDEIAREIVAGIPGTEKPVRIIRDRKEAVFQAIDESGAGDIVVIAGKGHEDYQIVGTKKYHFSDAEVAEEALNSKKG
ncbi:MAG: UDP-N-acetylmuramoyl-L-alanyl-D-glutamate--2,6-diaminopimelate ligase [Candidatus Latescibacteria bacterium 4484_7]|nr:MAG: UDP-N-acetylmuramoyl-L-alanyl-D-glutamate--2,6-diaminopimelate ligase [Candidatus Latescibacteria bacterium 4484_7]